MAASSVGTRLDPLDGLPCTEDFLEPTAGGKALALSVRWRVNGAVRALRALYAGSLESVLETPSPSSIRAEWARATSSQRSLVRTVWRRVSTWAASLPDVDGHQVFDPITRSVPVGERSSKVPARETEPQRGDVVGLQPQHVSLPPVGTKPVDIQEVAPELREYLDRGESLMLRKDEDVDWEAYDAIRPFSAPELQSRRVRLALCARMWMSGMLGTCTQCLEKLCVFTVLKKFTWIEGKKVASTRLVWDLRRSNLRWRTPPWVPLGSPISLSFVDLSDDITKGKVCTSCQGDLPDFFYRLKLPEWLLPWFVFDGVTPRELFEYMENAGLPTTGLDPCMPFLALCVLAMGWAWAVFFAHSVLQAIFNRSVRSLEAGSQLIDGCVTPQLDKFSRLFWLYIDDFSCLQLEPRGRKPEDLAIHDVAAECKEAIEKKGLTVHKETAGHGVEASLGTTISPGVPMLSVLPEKQSRIEAATRALLERGEGSAAEVEHLLGVWIWMMLPVRLALSVPCAIYEFMLEFAGMAPQRLPKLVQAELWCLVFLLPLFAVDLSAGWHEWAYQVDASLEGYGAVATRSWPEELRGEAQYCERKGWVVEAEKSFQTSKSPTGASTTTGSAACVRRPNLACETSRGSEGFSNSSPAQDALPQRSERRGFRGSRSGTSCMVLTTIS